MKRRRVPSVVVRALMLGALLVGGVLALIAWARWPLTPLPAGTTADRILVRKSERVLELYRGDILLRSYPVSLGWEPVGAKREEGDGRTPEGRYIIDSRNPGSGFHLALHVSYPRPEEEAAARARGSSAGGLIMIHGLPNGYGFLGRLHLVRDWTLGCVAVTDPEIEEIWRVVPNGTPVEFQP
ncbi:MAG TPA: L,D-transpeptidase family protein [Candidatus Polarisedimenticolia bacterium]|nr:L,D-transpeptidase family protein [Candidatus Polarisedimenticolia bacterium]